MAEQPNTSLTTLKVVSWVCVVVGGVLLIKGINGHDETVRSGYFSSTVSVPSYGSLVTGGALLGIAFQTWMLLLLFWALQHDRATRASYVAPTFSSPSAPTPMTPNRVQREAVSREAAAKVPMAWPDEDVKS